MKGKHEEKIIVDRLMNKITQLNKEIEETKTVVINIFDTILSLNESNDYGSPEVRRRLVSEICRNTIKELDRPLIKSSSN